MGEKPREITLAPTGQVDASVPTEKIIVKEETLELPIELIEQAVAEAAFNIRITSEQIEADTARFSRVTTASNSMHSTAQMTLADATRANSTLQPLVQHTLPGIDQGSPIVQVQRATIFQKLSQSFLNRGVNSSEVSKQPYFSVAQLVGQGFENLKQYITVLDKRLLGATQAEKQTAFDRIDSVATIIEFFNVATRRVLEMTDVAFDDKNVVLAINKALSMMLTKFSLLSLSMMSVVFGDAQGFSDTVLDGFFPNRAKKDRHLRGTQLGSFPLAFSLTNEFRSLLAKGAYDQLRMSGAETASSQLPRAMQTAWTINGLLAIARTAPANKDFLALRTPETNLLKNTATVLVFHNDHIYSLQLDAQKPISAIALAEQLAFLDNPDQKPTGGIALDQKTRMAIRRIMYEHPPEERPRAIRELFGETYGQITATISVNDANNSGPSDAVELLKVLHESPDTLAGLTGNHIPLAATLQFDQVEFQAEVPGYSSIATNPVALKDVALHAAHTSIYGLDLMKIATQLNGYTFLQSRGFLRTPQPSSSRPVCTALVAPTLRSLAVDGESSLGSKSSQWHEAWQNVGVEAPSIPPELIGYTKLSQEWNELFQNSLPTLNEKYDVKFSINLLMILTHLLTTREWKLHNMVTDKKGRLLVSDAVFPQIDTATGTQLFALVDSLLSHCASSPRSPFLSKDAPLQEKIASIQTFIAQNGGSAEATALMRQKLVESAQWARHSIDVCVGKKGTEGELPTVPLFAYASGDAEALLSALAKYAMNLREEGQLFNEADMVSNMASGQQIDRKTRKPKDPLVLDQARATLTEFVAQLKQSGELDPQTNDASLVEQMLGQIPIGAAFATAESGKYLQTPDSKLERVVSKHRGGNLGVCETYDQVQKTLVTHITQRTPIGQLAPDIMRRLTLKYRNLSAEKLQEYQQQWLSITRALATGTTSSGEQFWSLAPPLGSDQSTAGRYKKNIEMCIAEAKAASDERARNFEILLLFIVQLLLANPAQEEVVQAVPQSEAADPSAVTASLPEASPPAPDDRSPGLRAKFGRLFRGHK